MKVCIFQPEYSVDYTRSAELLQWELDALDRCDPSMDLSVLPEASDVPALAKTVGEFHESLDRFNDLLLKKAAETAKRCDAVLFVNAYRKTDIGWRNSTRAFDRTGTEVGHYD